MVVLDVRLRVEHDRQEELQEHHARHDGREAVRRVVDIRLVVHVDAGEIGEKVLKWFGALRPTDLDSF